MSRFTKIVLSLVISLLILVAGYWIIGSHGGETKIKLVAIPHDSALTLDGANVKEGSVYLRPGPHNLSANRQYFDIITKKVDTKDLKNNQVVYLLPIPSSSDALKWLRDHPDVQREREMAGGIQDQDIQNQLTQKYPFIANLPYSNSHYRIDYKIDPSGSLSFSITLYAIINDPSDYPQYKKQLVQYKSEALKYLKTNNISPEDFSISYIPKV